MRHNKCSIVISQLLLLLFSSCIYQTDELSFSDVKQTTLIAPCEVKLNFEKDSIVIYGETKFIITVNSFGKRFTAATISYSGYEYTSMDSISHYTISPREQNDGKWTELSVNFYFSTGSGSIADRLKIENYAGTKTWKIKYINLEKFNYNFGHKISADSVLELFWIKPDKDFDVSQASVYNNSPSNDYVFLVSRQNKDSVFYRVTEYVGGNQYYDLYIKRASLFKMQTINYPFPKMSLEDISLDTLLVSWDKSPFKVKYRLLTDGKEIYLGRDTSVIIQQIPIKKDLDYTLEFYSPSETVYDYLHRKDYISTYHGVGKKANYGYCYIADKDIFYLSRRSNYPNLSISGLPLPEDFDTYGGTLRLLSNRSGSLKAGVNSYVNLFNSNNEQIDRLEFKYNYQIEFLTVTDNNTLGFFNGTSYVVKNYGTDTSWKEFTFKPHYNDSTRWTYIRGLTMTEDGKYVACHGDFDFILYDISDHKNAKPIYQSPYGHAIGNPLNYNELIRIAQNKLEICALPDMQVLRKCDLSQYENIILLNVDPYSHILAISSTNYIVLIDINTMQVVYKIRTTYVWDDTTRLYRKQLFTPYKQAIDLTKYLP